MNSDEETPSEEEADNDASNSKERPLIIASKELLQGRREVWIEHEDEMYRLRVTGNGKLYLSK